MHTYSHWTRGGTPVVLRRLKTCLPTPCMQGPEGGAAAGSQLGWGALLAPKSRRVMILAAGLTLFQQLSGINTVVFYSSEVRPALVSAECTNLPRNVL